jgi:hypothetical protein
VTDQASTIALADVQSWTIAVEQTFKSKRDKARRKFKKPRFSMRVNSDEAGESVRGEFRVWSEVISAGSNPAGKQESGP